MDTRDTAAVRRIAQELLAAEVAEEEAAVDAAEQAGARRFSIRLKALRKVQREFVEIMDYAELIEGLNDETVLSLYQVKGVRDILKTEKVLLADDRGTGKTLQSLTAAVNSGAKTVIIVTPSKGLDDVWVREINDSFGRDRKGDGVGRYAGIDITVLGPSHFTEPIKPNLRKQEIKSEPEVNR